jgi:hypothetical protein
LSQTACSEFLTDEIYKMKVGSQLHFFEVKISLRFKSTSGLFLVSLFVYCSNQKKLGFTMSNQYMQGTQKIPISLFYKKIVTPIQQLDRFECHLRRGYIVYHLADNCQHLDVPCPKACSEPVLPLNLGSTLYFK